MDKKGFISISVVYSFFLVFIAIVLSILAAYSSRRYMLIEIKTDIRNIVDEKTTNICLSKGITKLNECILDIYGGIDYIESQETPDFSKVTADGEYGLYRAADDYGTSYYFRGDVENNYVEFGTYAEDTTFTIFDYDIWGEKTVEVKAGSPMYWRIVRINGDGSIRLIYDGIELVANGVAHTATIKATIYNPNYYDAKSVGYTYDVDGTETNSTIKGVVDAWYDKHLKTTYGKYIADSIFCNDRQVTSSDEYGNTYYAPYDRLVNYKKPELTCTNKEDRYTVSTALGNGKLTDAEGNARPIGLLTADEAYFAGGNNMAGNNSFYLYSSEYYWTSAPSNFVGYGAHVWYVNYDGGVYGSYGVGFSNPGARPVINLKADVEIKKGNGTISSPYVLEEVTH